MFDTKFLKSFENKFKEEKMNIDLIKTHYKCVLKMANPIIIENKIILMDPVFSKRCSPSSILGPKRLVEIPITIDRIPK